MNVKENANGVSISIRVNPASGRFKLYRESGRVVLDIKSRPEKGKANAEILAGLSKMFGRETEIIRGRKSRDKTVLIRDVSRKDIERILGPE